MRQSRVIDLDGLDGVLRPGVLARDILREVMARSPAGVAAAAVGASASQSPALPTGRGQDFVIPKRPFAPVAIAADDRVPLDEQPTRLAKRPPSVPPPPLEQPAAEILNAPRAPRRIAVPL